MRALNMQSLTAAIRRRWPGVVVYGIGDEAHKLHPSDHNEDDTPGSRPAQTDADSTPEHRAIDVMLGPTFSRADAYALVDALVSDPASRRRLFYIIFDGWIWSRSSDWAKRRHDGDPHRDHPHISGWAADDENAAGWPAVEQIGDDMPTAEEIAAEVWKGGGPQQLLYRVEALISQRSVVAGAKAEPNKLAEQLGKLDAILAAVLNVDEEVVARLGSAEMTAEQIANVLRPVLGDRAVAVGQALAGS